MKWNKFYNNNAMNDGNKLRNSPVVDSTKIFQFSYWNNISFPGSIWTCTGSIHRAIYVLHFFPNSCRFEPKYTKKFIYKSWISVIYLIPFDFSAIDKLDNLKKSWTDNFCLCHKSAFLWHWLGSLLVYQSKCSLWRWCR